MKPFRRKLFVLVALLGPVVAREGPSPGWVFAFSLALTLVGVIFLTALGLLLRKKVLPNIRASSWELNWQDSKAPSTDQTGKEAAEGAARVEGVECLAIRHLG